MFPDINFSIPGWTTPYDLLCLAWLAKSVPSDGHMVEIGAFCGRATSVLLRNRQLNCKVSIVDNFEAIHPVFNSPHKGHFERMMGDKTEFRNLPITEISGTWINAVKHYVGDHSNFEIHMIDSKNYGPPLNVDLAFIDGSHQGDKPLEDINLFIKNENCLIILDDYDMINQSDVVKAVNFVKYETGRATYTAPTGRFCYLLPKSGYMLPKITKLIELTARFNTIEKIKEAFKNSDWQP